MSSETDLSRGSDSLLRVRDLRFSYDDRLVLEDVDLELEEDTTVALVGPSGSGKTTLLEVCGGLLTPDSGRVANSFERSAMVFQDSSLLPWKTAGENMALGLKAEGVDPNERRERVRKQARAMDLTGSDLDKYPEQLSGGMKCRVALGRALVFDPELLFLDEPFTALDMGLKEEFYRYVLEAQGTAILMITHDITEAARLAEQIHVLASDPGRVVRSFSLDVAPSECSYEWAVEKSRDLCGDPTVREVFGLTNGERQPEGTMG